MTTQFEAALTSTSDSTELIATLREVFEAEGIEDVEMVDYFGTLILCHDNGDGGYQIHLTHDSDAGGFVDELADEDARTVPDAAYRLGLFRL